MKFLDYDEKMGDVSYPDGFFELIKDLPVSEQMDFFAPQQASDARMRTGMKEILSTPIP